MEPLFNRHSYDNAAIIEMQASQNRGISSYCFDKFKEEVQNNNIVSFLDDHHPIYNHLDNDLHKPILILALAEFKSVSSETVKFLLDKGANIDYIDRKWYGWEPLHYAARAAEPTKLKEIVRNLSASDKINSLTNLSENALHVLLDGFESTFVSYQNGSNLKMSNVVARGNQNVLDCANILIDAGIDVNHNNFWNETPILVALKHKHYDMVQVLLRQQQIDLDSCRDPVSGRSARDLLKGQENRFGMLPKRGTQDDPEKILFQLLKAGDEEGFSKYNGGKIDHLANAMDGGNSDNSSCNLLQYCFRRGLIAWYHERKDHEHQIHHQDITAHSLVQVFCRHGMAKTIQHLLDNGADINFVSKKFPEPLLEVAITKGYYPLVALIVGRPDAPFFPAQICKTLTKLLRTDNVDVDNTLAILLNKLLTVRLGPEEIANVLKVLAEGVRMMRKDNVALLLKFPGSLCVLKPATNKSILEEIDPEVVRTHLDECIEQKGNQVYVNYDSFFQNGTDRALQTFIDSPPLNSFLDHLVFKILINRKWENLRYGKLKYFYLNLVFCVFFYVVLNVHILFKFNGVTDALATFFHVLNIICVVIFVAKELVQVLANCALYVKEFNNYAELFFIAMTIWMFFASQTFVDVAMVLTVLSSNLVLLLFLEQVPKLAQFMIILRTVVFYLQYIVFYFIQFVAFAICFYILFSEPDQVFWKDLPNKIFETIVIFTGNFEAMNTNKFQNKEFFSKVIFILFVLFMAIILNNLLLGVLVTDMSNLNDRVKLFQQVKRAGFVVRLESVFASRILRKFPLVFKDRITLFENGKYLIVNDADRKMLGENEKQYLDFMLVKKNKRQNVLTKLYGYLKKRINAMGTEPIQQEFNKEVLQKLQFMEETIRNLQEQGRNS